MPRLGLEPSAGISEVAVESELTTAGGDDRTKYDTKSAGKPAIDDPDLAAVVPAWPTLADPIRRAVLALIGAGGGQ